MSSSKNKQAPINQKVKEFQKASNEEFRGMNTSRSSLKSIKLEEMVKNNYRKLDHYVEKLNSFRTKLNHNKTV